ncbi:hypothetical protein GGP41_005370 [Bipolaris sorokiniana]|uniref:Uncharacterized protein n=1 Tax=Cochliobolus sativus TaxID=45130 RepID=A0A8H6DW00_COCSA|nr:hypothetical protein GGP41_005370 [Bipolaris sorokiniana]
MGKRVLNNDTNRRYSSHRRPRLLGFAMGTAMWVSSAATSTSILALQPHPTGNDVLRRWQSVSPPSFLIQWLAITLIQQVKNIPDSVLFTGIALCSALYAASCMHVYHTAPRSVSITLTACILLVFLETVWNGLNVTPVERLAVVLPSLVNIGLSWILVHQSRELPKIVLEGLEPEV